MSVVSKMRVSKKGFTLVEMLAVVVIVAVLALVAIPAFIGSRTQAEDSSCDSNRQAIISSITNYQSRTGALASTAETAFTNSTGLGSTLIAGNFLGSVPQDPKNPGAPTNYKYTVEAITVTGNATTAGGSGFKVTVKCGLTSNDHGSDIALL